MRTRGLGQALAVTDLNVVAFCGRWPDAHNCLELQRLGGHDLLEIDSTAACTSCRQLLQLTALSALHPVRRVSSGGDGIMASQTLMATTAHLQHDLGLIVQLLGLLSDRLVLEDLGVAAVGIAAPQLPRLQQHQPSGQHRILLVAAVYYQNRLRLILRTGCLAQRGPGTLLCDPKHCDLGNLQSLCHYYAVSAVRTWKNGFQSMYSSTSSRGKSS